MVVDYVIGSFTLVFSHLCFCMLCQINEGDGAFYGPKIDISVSDALKRKFQCATLQVLNIHCYLLVRLIHYVVLQNDHIYRFCLCCSLTFSFLIVSTWVTQRKMKPRQRDLLWYTERYWGLLNVCLLYCWNITRGSGLFGSVHVKQLFALCQRNPNHMLYR